MELLEQNKILNLSEKFLSTTQISLLAKDFKLTATTRRPDPNEMKDNTMEFCQKLRLTEALFNFPRDEDSLVKNKCEYCPLKCRSKTPDDFCERIANCPYDKLQKQVKPN